MMITAMLMPLSSLPLLAVVAAVGDAVEDVLHAEAVAGGVMVQLLVPVHPRAVWTAERPNHAR